MARFGKRVFDKRGEWFFRLVDAEFALWNGEKIECLQQFRKFPQLARAIAGYDNFFHMAKDS